MKTPQNILLPIIFTVFLFGCSNAQQKETQTKDVPKELKERMELYWKYYRQEEWAKIYEIADTSMYKKQDYIEMRKKEKTKPDRMYNSIEEIALENKMHYIPESNKWRLLGCTKVIGRDGNDYWLDTQSAAFLNEKKEWVVSGVGFPIESDGTLKPCDKDVSVLPIKIRVNELK